MVDSYTILLLKKVEERPDITKAYVSEEKFKQYFASRYETKEQSAASKISLLFEGLHAAEDVNGNLKFTVPLMDESEITEELSIKFGEPPIIITAEIRKYLPKELLDSISKAEKACQEMKQENKVPFEKVVTPTKRIPRQMMSEIKR